VRRRILQSTLLVVTITALVLGAPLAVTTWRLVEDITRADLTALLERVEARLEAEGSTIPDSELQLAVPSNGRLVVQQPGQPERRIGVNVGENPVSQSLPFGIGGAITLEEPRSAMLAQQIQATLVVLGLVLLSVAAGTVVATVTARRLAEPLSGVADRAARLGAGDFRSAPRRHGIPELDRVSDVLDTSAAALSELVQRERELVGDVSHQLRSRITALQLRLDELAAHPDPDARREAVAALEQTEKLSAVLDDLLEAARAARAAGAELMDLREGLAPVVEEWRPTLRTAGRGLKVRLPDGLLTRVTPARIREAVGALLDNALRHGEGTVSLTARAVEGSLVIEVADGGAGVPEDLVPHVFDRGVSGRSSTGLGLALARALVEADGGRLELSRMRPALFTIFLPAARADDVMGAPRPVRGPR
jgi:signal transduction histidine kinase